MNKICLSLLKNPTAPLYRLYSHLTIKSNVDSKKKKKKKKKNQKQKNKTKTKTKQNHKIQRLKITRRQFPSIFFFLVYNNTM